MAYFSNGTEGAIFEERWCSRCVHEEGCAVWAVHLMHNYEQDIPQVASILHELIAEDPDDSTVLECRMFHAVAEGETMPPDPVEDALKLKRWNAWAVQTAPQTAG